MSKYLIINADDFGVCHSVNQAIIELFEEGAITSSTIMAPCPWFPEAARYASNNPDKCVGIHLTTTSEWESYRWGPVSRESVSHLVKDGYFPQDIHTFESISKEEEVEREIRAQIKLAASYGINASHLDNHMGSLYGRCNIKSYISLVFQICSEMDLPFRLPKKFLQGYGEIAELTDQPAEELNQFIQQAFKLKIPLIDYLIMYPFGKLPGEDYTSFRDFIIMLLHKLPEGFSEIAIHPSVDSKELRAYHPEWEKRIWEYKIFKDPLVRSTINECEIKLVSWRDLQKSSQI